jgi:hypothetical protein
MPSTVRSDLNKTVHAEFTPAQFGAAVLPVAAFTYRVSEPLGISLTGWEANMQMNDNADININNGIVVELIENLLFPHDQASITAILQGRAPGGNSMFFIGFNSATQYINTFRQYQYPIQLRYGTEYTLYMRALMAAVVTDLITLSLTAFGYPNADQGQPVIQLR